MKLLERDQFISDLSELFEKVKSENGHIVSVSGEAGIGKTSLVEYFTKSFEDQAKILWGTCDDLFTPRPLAPLYDIASQLKSKIVEQLDSGIPRPSIFSNFLSEILTGQPNIIVIEDVHWAEESTLDLLQFLGRRINKSKTLLIITYRDDEIKSSHQLKLALSSIPSKYFKRIKIPPLSKEAVKKLAVSFGREDENLFSKTNGNPLLVTEVLSNEEFETPPTIKELLISKLNRLSADSKNIVELISVIPGKAEKWLVQKLVKDVSLIDEVIEIGVLKSEDDSILFRHELTRMAIEESLPESKRSRLNYQVLNALLKQKNLDHFLARIMHHATKADDSDSIIKYAPLAAKQASNLGAHKQAAKIYQTVLKYNNLLSAEQHLDLLEGSSYEYFLTGQIDEGIKSSETILDILKQYPDPEREGEIYRRLSRILWYDCKDKIGEEYLNKAIEIFEKLPPGNKLALAYSNKSQTYAIREETKTALYWGERALELSRKLGDLETEVHALNNLGCARMLIEDNEGEKELLQSLELSVKNDFYEQAARAYVNLGCIQLQRRNLYEADKYFSRGLEYGNEKDIYVFSYCMAGHFAKTKLHLGMWTEAIELGNFVLNQKSAALGNTVMPSIVIATIRTRRNDPGALKLINKSFDLSFKMGEVEKITAVTSLKSEYLWLQNKLSEFVNDLHSIYLLILKSNNSWAIGEIAYWLWKAGSLIEIPKHISKPYLLQIQGKWKEAAEIWEELHCPYEQALALSEGDEDAMKKSLETFERLGASATVQLIKQKMRESGIRSIPKGPHKTTKENIAGLTLRQFEVLKLVANGMSNSEIASNLYISAKTVDHHVSAIFSKLNIHSRIEAAVYLQSNPLSHPVQK